MSATRDIDLQYFRADNSFLWQGRDRNSELHYLITSLYLQRTDPLGLFSKLKEDGLFGAEVVTVGDQLTVSRDLLDSIVEIYFLERHLAISGLSGLSILDVGAGYGRLAHRMVEALPELGQYLCVDAIAISTFISEYYLCFRGVGEKAKVIPLFDIEDALSNNHIDIAVNIHSFSEIPLVSIRWWLETLSRYNIKYLMIVPNALRTHGGTIMDSSEKDGSRLDLFPVIQSHGYKLIVQERKYLDESVGKYGVSPTYQYLFELSG